MWFLIFGVFALFQFSKMDVISNRYCTDMRPQSYVTIEQLLGMWYGVELISHKHAEQRFGVQYVESCPIVHISEDSSPTIAPHYKGNTRHPYGIYYDSTDPNRNPLNVNDYNNNNNNQNNYDRGPYGPNYGQGQNTQYEQTGHRASTYYQGIRYGPDEYPRRYADDIKRLRLLWTDNGGYVEYNLRYNTSKPGFWMSSGPQNGSSLDSQFNQFAGTIQVIKAVGNHLVLTFCFQLPDQQLYTILLSRVPRLTKNEISDVHDLLTQRALETSNIKKICSENGSFKFGLDFYVILSSIFLILFKTFT